MYFFSHSVYQCYVVVGRRPIHVICPPIPSASSCGGFSFLKAIRLFRHIGCTLSQTISQSKIPTRAAKGELTVVNNTARATFRAGSSTGVPNTTAAAVTRDNRSRIGSSGYASLLCGGRRGSHVLHNTVGLLSRSCRSSAAGGGRSLGRSRGCRDESSSSGRARALGAGGSR